MALTRWTFVSKVMSLLFNKSVYLSTSNLHCFLLTGYKESILVRI